MRPSMSLRKHKVYHPTTKYTASATSTALRAWSAASFQRLRLQAKLWQSGTRTYSLPPLANLDLARLPSPPKAAAPSLRVLATMPALRSLQMAGSLDMSATPPSRATWKACMSFTWSLSGTSTLSLRKALPSSSSSSKRSCKRLSMSTSTFCICCSLKRQKSDSLIFPSWSRSALCTQTVELTILELMSDSLMSMNKLLKPPMISPTRLLARKRYGIKRPRVVLVKGTISYPYPTVVARTVAKKRPSTTEKSSPWASLCRSISKEFPAMTAMPTRMTAQYFASMKSSWKVSVSVKLVLAGSTGALGSGGRGR
mmetsp:Transcript_67162/g.151870  ORF Transcript_67162/g.151870 Transcript_67162/m.151870 type:complete len:312 (-) Transcript_67162:746-1681(-)